MAKQNRTVLKTYFESGDIPNQSQYSDLIDSNLNLSETTDQTTAGGLNITGNITASGNISASGTIFADNFQSTGGDVAGISFTDDLNLTGNITASGNISASGDLLTSGITRAASHRFIEDNVYIADGGSDLDIVGGGLNANGNITASGAISASGNLIGYDITTRRDITVGRSLNAAGNISSSGDIIASDLILTSPNGSKFKFTVNNSGHLSLTGSAV